MNTAQPPAASSAGLSTTTILGTNAARAASLRTVTPFAHGMTWLGTFLGIACGGFVLTALCPNGVELPLIAMAVFTLIVAALSITSARWMPEELRYPIFRLTSITAILLLAVIFLLGREAVAVLMVVSIGFPLQMSHFLEWRDLRRLLCVWTSVVAAAVIYAVAEGGSSNEIVPLFVAAVPLTWVTSVICFQLSEARFAAIDAASMRALRDSQTGLANRRGMAEIGAAMIARDRAAGVVLIDLDEFKTANTLYGHAGGDRVIDRVSEALLELCGETHLAARLGGDEFVVVLSSLGGETPAQLERACAGAVAALNDELGLPAFELSASTGSAVFVGDGRTIDDMLRVAERRLSRAKESRSAREPRRAQARAFAPVTSVPAPPLPPERELGDEIFAQSGVLRRSSGVLVAALVLLASVPFLDTNDSRPWIVALVGLSLLAGFAVNRLTDVAVHPSIERAAGFAAYLLIGVVAYLSGGADGPALPLLFVLIAYDARDDEFAEMGAKLALAEVVAISPLFYLSGVTDVEREVALGIVAAIVVMLPLVVGLMLRFRAQLAGARRTARELARRDALTGVLNRRAFEVVASAAIASGERCAIVMIDLDNFKAVNTADGYAGGDAVLAAIGESLSGATRALDSVGRVGGDEFAALLRETRSLDVSEAASRFMLAVDSAVAQSDSIAARRVSASCGIAVHPEHGDDLAALMLAADDALMRVKHSGKSAALVQSASR